MPENNNEEIPDYQLADIVKKMISLIPDRMTPIGIMKIARTLEREYFNVYLGTFPEQIDDVLRAQQVTFNEFQNNLKQISDHYFEVFKNKNK